MKATKLFRIIWRINGIVILGLALFAAVILLWGVGGIIRGATSPRNDGTIVNAPQDGKETFEWSLSDFSTVEGTTYLMASAYSDHGYGLSSYEKSSPSVRNHLFVNTEDQTSQWLFPHHDYVIRRTSRLCTGKKDEDNKSVEEALSRISGSCSGKKVIGFIYIVVKEDTNGDGMLTGADKVYIAISDSRGQSYKDIIKEGDAFLGHKLLSSERLLAFYTKDNDNFMTEIDLEAGSISKIAKLPRVP